MNVYKMTPIALTDPETGKPYETEALICEIYGIFSFRHPNGVDGFGYSSFKEALSALKSCRLYRPKSPAGVLAD